MHHLARVSRSGLYCPLHREPGPASKQPPDSLQRDHRSIALPSPPRLHPRRVGTCDYSVHPRAIGSRVEVTQDLEWVVVRRGQEEVARHRRSLAPHRTLTDPVHVEAREPQRGLEPPAAPLATEVGVRDLAVYDQVLGAL